MTPREIFLGGLQRGNTPRVAVGSATSIVTTDLMDRVGAWFPDAHLEAEPMAALAAAGHTELGFDNVMPLFGVWHESAALGCQVEWGTRDRMPDSRHHLCDDIHQPIHVPDDLIERPGCAVPLAALRLLKRRFGDRVAVIGKVFGPWTLGYHVFGVENFLISTITEPDAVRQAMRSLAEVTVQFGQAQIEAGADALTLADHATRDLCSPDSYRDYLVEVHRELRRRLACPLILHICGDTSDRIPMIRDTGIECFHFDSKVATPDARQLAGEELALMGGTSNFDVIRSGTPESIAADVPLKLQQRIDVVGPECAVPLDAPWENLKLLGDEAKRQSVG